MKPCIQILLRPAEPGFQSPLDSTRQRIILGSVWGVWARLRRLPTPSNWTAEPWHEELWQSGIEAAMLAERERSAPDDDSLQKYVYHRVQTSLFRRYRREWTYAKYFTSLLSETDPLDPECPKFLEPVSSEAAPDQLAALHEVCQSVNELSAPDQFLVTKIFVQGCTECELAHSLHLSQRAISKRKQKVLRKLRNRLSPGKWRREQARRTKQACLRI